jgi:6-methylsalicylate decarboxylase
MLRISDASRREFLAALGLSAVVPANRMFAQGAVDTHARRIDVHGHLTPPIVLETVGAAELGNFAKWTPEIALEQMDKLGIATAMLSVPPHYDPKTVDRVARPSNEYGARLAQDHKGRFGNFAFLPMPHVDATLKEIEYVFDTLKLDGVGMYTNYGDKWIGDAAFNPVFEELNRRNAIVSRSPRIAATAFLRTSVMEPSNGRPIQRAPSPICSLTVRPCATPMCE